MRLLVLGASGQCGQWLARLAAKRGHTVTALVRPETSYVPPDSVSVCRGQATDSDVIREMRSDQDAVRAALGLRRAGQSPWSSLQSPVNLTRRAAALLVDAMPRHGIRRRVAISADGVGNRVNHLPWPVKRHVRTGNAAVAYRDLIAAARPLLTGI